MRINNITTTVTFDEVARALGVAMESSGDLGAFNKVEIESINEETKEFNIKLSRKGRRGARNTSATEDNDVPQSDGLDDLPENEGTDLEIEGLGSTE